MGTGTAMGGGAPAAGAAPHAYPIGGPGYGAGHATGPPPGFEGVASPYHPHVSNAGRAKRGGLVVLALRALAAMLAVICFAVDISASISLVVTDLNGDYYSGSFKAFNLKPYKALLASALIVVVYEVAMIISTLVAANAMSQYMASLGTFVVDQILAYLMLAAGTASATLVSVYRSGDGGFYSAQCDGPIKPVCSKAAAASAMGFLTFALLAAVAVISAGRVAS